MHHLTAHSEQQQAGWEARLELGFAQCGERTVLSHRRHYGPLAVQRPFYPEPDGTCHVYVLHPPGGVVGGDGLELLVVTAVGSRALLTTPAATKFYRSAGRAAHQQQRLSVGSNSRLEWLPQENIVYDGARVVAETKVELETGAGFLGWDITCLGRPTVGERFASGHFEQRLEVWRGDEPLLLERARYEGGSDALRQSYGLGGQPVVGLLVCVMDERFECGPPPPLASGDALVSSVRGALDAAAPGEAACSQLRAALICRYLGSSVERAQQAFVAAWRVLRPHCFLVPAIAPRIWAT